MEWALVLLIGVSALLLIISIFQFKKLSKVEQQEIDLVTISLKQEIEELSMQIRNLEIDIEIVANEAGLQSTSSKERLLMREILDLYRRGYSIDSIAAEKKLTVEVTEELLSPYKSLHVEGRNAANEN